MTDKTYFRLSETIAYLNVIFSLIGGFHTTYFIVSCIDSFPTCCIYVSNINVQKLLIFETTLKKVSYSTK